MARARQYIEWVDAAHVFPCAGPPAFLDDDLFALNDFDRDPANIFPDQTVFLDVLRDAGIDTRRAARARFGRRARRRRVQGHAPGRRRRDVRGRSPTSARTSTSTSATGRRGSRRERASWSHGRRDLVAELAAWFEPLLQQRADHVGRASPATSCSTSASPAPTCASTSSSREVRVVATASRTSTRPTSTGG